MSVDCLVYLISLNVDTITFTPWSHSVRPQLELHDSTIEGHRITIGWGKAVKINATPFSLPTAVPGLIPAGEGTPLILVSPLRSASIA